MLGSCFRRKGSDLERLAINLASSYADSWCCNLAEPGRKMDMSCSFGCYRKNCYHRLAELARLVEGGPVEVDSDSIEVA